MGILIKKYDYYSKNIGNIVLMFLLYYINIIMNGVDKHEGNINSDWAG